MLKRQGQLCVAEINKNEVVFLYNIFSYRISGLQPSAIREILKFTADPSVISFAAGNPAPEAFPVETIRKLSDDILREEPVSALQYSVTEGYTPLRDWLKADMKEKGVFKQGRDELVITSGAQQAIEVITKILCNESETIICEKPSFVGALNSFRSYNAKLVGVDMDDEGIIPEKLDKALKDNPRTAFIYLIPNFQNPTGKTMSFERRKQILNIAAIHKVFILEDNPYGDLRFDGIDIPSLKALDKNSLVIYVGSFSKILAPGLRVGWLAAPEHIIQKSVVAMQVSTVHTNIWAQMIAYRFVTTVDFNEHLENLRYIYKKKYELMIGNLQFRFPNYITFTEPEGGLFIWGTLPKGSDMMKFCRTAVEHKVAIVPGSAFMPKESDVTTSFRLNYSTPTDLQIENGVEILAKVAKKLYYF
ncbi:MAG: PLP-dependent aminotransferase family protein [Clostridiales bacterium]|nr:PLP-dependent aminotransferase family protein [Clostridiales bacterium]